MGYLLTKAMLLVLMLIPVCLSAATAETRLIAGVPGVIESKPAKGILPARNRTIMGLTVGKHSLADVKAKLGNAPVYKARDAEGRPNTICYSSAKRNDNTVVVFEAGPLGGFEELTGITVGSADLFSQPYQGCTKSNKVDRRSVAAGDLKLGVDVERVAHALRVKVSRTKAGLLEFPYQLPTTIKQKGSAKSLEGETSSGVVADDSGGKVRWFSVYFIQSM
jgi:hypothetical protein